MEIYFHGTNQKDLTLKEFFCKLLVCEIIMTDPELAWAKKITWDILRITVTYLPLIVNNFLQRPSLLSRIYFIRLDINKNISLD